MAKNAGFVMLTTKEYNKLRMYKKLVRVVLVGLAIDACALVNKKCKEMQNS